MARSVVLFFAALLLGLTAGRAFWVSLGENPFSISGAVYVEFFQQLDSRIAIPIAITGAGGTLLAGISAIYSRDDRIAFVLTLSAFALGAISCLATIFVNVPINHQIAAWNPAALPADYASVLHRWWSWHQSRLFTMLPATCLVLIAMLRSRTN
jgi:uncharacterized membrane protein